MEYVKIGIEIFLILIGLYIILFKAYFKKKGENIATKEDIGKITKEIEEVKNEFSFHNQKRSDLFFEKKKNLIEFYDNYFLWVNDSMRIADVILSYHNNHVFLRESINNLKSIHIKVLANYSRIIIYIDDNEFNSEISRIYNDTIKNHNSIIRFLITLEDISLNHKALKKRLSRVNNQNGANEIKIEFNKLIDSRDECFDKFQIETKSLEKLLEKNKETLIEVFRNKVRNEYAQAHNNVYI